MGNLTIKDNRKEEYTCFDQIGVGETFVDEDHDICIKLRPSQEEYNCYCFSNNTLYTIERTWICHPVNTTLIIE